MLRTSLPFELALRRIALVLATALLMLAGARPATAAQTRPQPTPVVLSEVKLLSESADESRFELAFDPTTTTFAPIASAATRPSIGFALATRRAQAVQPRGMKGLVRGIAFEQADTVLILHFAATQAATISAAPSGRRTVEVTVSTGKPARGYDEPTVAAAPGGSLPPGYAPPPGEDGYEIVLLKYADVSEVVGLLSDGQTIKSNDVFIPSEPAFGSNSLTGNNYNPQPTPPAAGQSDEPLGQSVDASIGVDRRLNAIWLKGSPERIARMKAMIALIDIPLDSVVLETQFVELTEKGEKALGIDFNNANGQIGLVTFHSGEAIIPGTTQGCNGEICSGHVTSAAFQAALYAQISKGNGRIVSRPRIAAQSGSTAKIITGDALPILTAITLSGVNGVSQQVQYVNVGVTLQIAPRVSGDGFVSSHVFCVVSSVTGFSQGYPTISQREAETSTTVRDGDSFVIGGLTQDTDITSRSKVPILGDIPILGQAFRTDKDSRSKTELYIVVTPRIVHRVGIHPSIVPSNAPLYAPTTTTTIPIEPPSESSVPPAPPPPRR
jgi:general secretion pathway protein D